MTEYDDLDYFTDQSLVPDPYPYFDHLRSQCPVLPRSAQGVVAVTAAEAIHPDLPGYERMVLERQSIKRRGHANDIAAAIVFLASEEAGFITGQTLAVDGGWIMH